ncbi:MAG: homoserine O-succinyltransferase [Arenimonas sp.]
MSLIENNTQSAAPPAHVVNLADGTPPADGAQLAPDTEFAANPHPAPVTNAWRHSFLHTICLRHAGPRQVRIAFECQGAADAPVLLVAGGISAHRHVAASASFVEPGWWPEQVGPGAALDTDRYRVVAIDWLGADGSLDAPIDSGDQADAFAALLDHLRIERVAAFIGCSYGAMVGLQFAARHRTRLDCLLAISGADRPHPFASAWRALQRRIARLGRSESACREGLSLARQLAMLSYRTPEEFAARFATPAVLVDGNARCAAEDYLDARGASYVARTPLTAFLRLSESIDLHAVEPEAVAVPTVVVAIEEDRLVPKATLIALAERLPALRRLHVLRSGYGHDAFLKETPAIAAIIRATLREAAGVSA